MKRRLTYGALFLGVFVMLAGCAVGPDYVKPDIPVEKNWDGVKSAPTPPTPLTPAAAATAKSEAYALWWRTFNDPALDRLINEALESNLDLKLAEARIRDARAQLIIARSNGLPQVNASASDTHGRASKNVIIKTPTGSFSTNVVTDLYKAGFDAEWEIDVFGGIRRGVEAAQAGIDSAIEDSRSVRVTLLGEVAGNYIDLRSFQSQLAIARNNLKSQEDTLELTQARYMGGLSSGLDVARAESQAAGTESLIPIFETSIKRAVYRLGVLLGKDPSALAEELAKEGKVPAPSAGVLPGLPSELLLRRPDIRRAERQLAVATARIGVATADLYPHFNLTALLGLQSSASGNLFAAGSEAWQIVPGFTLPLFTGGRITANIESKNAGEEQALISYRQTILTALEEVENSLVAYYKEDLRLKSLRKEVEQDRLAVELSNERYVKGLTGFIDVLDAERSLYSSQSRLSQSEAAVSSNLVALYKALGGGWETPESQAKQ